MAALALHEFHRSAGAVFTDVNGQEIVENYGNWQSEYAALRDGAAVLDLSSRGRLCVLGADRQRFINGQVTNNVKDLKPGDGCYAALVSAKGKLQSDLTIFCLENELLLDLEPGYSGVVSQRLEQYVIAEDAQIIDASADYGLLSVQGPKAMEVVGNCPPTPLSIIKLDAPDCGEIYVANRPRLRAAGIDLFVPIAAMKPTVGKLLSRGGQMCGYQAFEIARVEAGIPRFGTDMDETNLAPEALGPEAISYSKGCYIGQEVIARIRTYGQVAKSLRALKLDASLKEPPSKGSKLLLADKEIGFITSAVWSPQFEAVIALGYVRREANQAAGLLVQTSNGNVPAQIVDRP